MPRVFVFLRGEPGVGKITVARLLSRDLPSWDLLWFHDFCRDEPAGGRASEDAERRVMAAVRESVGRRHDKRKSVIYVRPARTAAAVNPVRAVAASADYHFLPIRLTAEYATLCERIRGRAEQFRVSTPAELDKYRAGRVLETVPGEVVIATDDLSAGQVAGKVLAAIVEKCL
jgi:hypothetical protein